MPTDIPVAPRPGQIVRVRSRQYLVEGLVPPQDRGDQTLVRNTLRWHCVTATDPRLFQAPWRAGIDVKAYQLEPLRKTLQLPRVNLFIADDVGLGKTIEAGLIVRELLLRQRVRRIVVCCPPSVVLQWQDEMEQRFGLTFQVFDRELVLAAGATGATASTPGPPTLASSSRTRCCATPPTPNRCATGWAPSAPAPCSSSMKPTTPPPPAAPGTPSTPGSRRRCARSRPASSTGCS